MQIVIDISKELYEKILNLPNFISADATQIIREGIPLPKHGRLIDADTMKTMKNIQSANFNAVELIRLWIDKQPTIIEVDKEQEDNANSN